MSRRFAGAGLSRRAARSPVSSGAIDPIVALGADLLFWWEASDATVTRDGGNLVSQVDERVGGARHLVQATGSNQPLYQPTGGPNSTEAITFNDTGDTLLATALTGMADGNRVGLYVVASLPAAGAVRVVCETLNAVNGVVQGVHVDATNRYRFQSTFTGGLQTLVVVTPAHDTDFHVFASRPIDSGALAQIDGVTANPDFTGTDTLDDQTQLRVGRNTVSAGTWCSAMLVSEPTDAKDTIVRAYYAQRYGL